MEETEENAGVKELLELLGNEQFEEFVSKIESDPTLAKMHLGNGTGEVLLIKSRQSRVVEVRKGLTVKRILAMESAS